MSFLKTASYHSIELSNGNIWKVSSFSSEGCPWKVPRQSCYITSFHISSYPVCLICFSLFSALIPRRTGVNEPHSGGIQDCQRDILAVYKPEGDRESFRSVAVTLKEIRTLPNKWKFLLERWLFIYCVIFHNIMWDLIVGFFLQRDLDSSCQMRWSVWVFLLSRSDR